MADAEITRGTTPTVTVTVGMDLTGWSCYLSVGKKPGSPWFTADNTQMEMAVDTSGETPVSTLVYTLTQEQTLSCKAGKAKIQIRVIEGDTALASEMAEINVLDVVKGGEIADDYD